MPLLRVARPNISIMGSSWAPLVDGRTVAHGVRESGLLEKVASSGRSQRVWLNVDVARQSGATVASLIGALSVLAECRARATVGRLSRH